MSVRFFVVLTPLATIIKRSPQHKQRMICLCYVQPDSRDGVHSEEFSLSRAFGNCFSLSLNACFVLFWNCVLVVVSLSNGTLTAQKTVSSEEFDS